MKKYLIRLNEGDDPGGPPWLAGAEAGGEPGRGPGAAASVVSQNL